MKIIPKLKRTKKIEVTKDEISLAIQSCINSYRGKHGKIVEWMFDQTACEFGIKKGVEWYLSYMDDTVYITFRGSDGTADWIDNLKFFKRPVKSIKNNKKVVPYARVSDKIKVHSGFIKQYKAVRKDILDNVRVKKRAGFKKFIITGHSLGGALATLASLDIQYNIPDIDVVCLPFASPRVGNKHWKKSFNKRMKACYRFVYKNDIVCKVPMSILFYNHVGKEVKLGAKNKWWERILRPFTRNIGNPLDHYPQKYLKAVKKLKWST